MASPPADFTLREQDGVTVVSLRTANLLGIPDVSRIGAELNALVGKGARRVVLDLAAVSYAGSAALGMLLSLMNELKVVGGKLVLMNVEPIDGLLKISRTRAVFEIAPDPAAALRMF